MLQAAADAAEAAENARNAAEAGAGVAYTVFGAGLQMIGFQVAGYVAQSQAETAGKQIASSVQGTRLYGAFQKIGGGNDLAPLLLAPPLAEAFARAPQHRARIAPILALLVSEQVFNELAAMFPIPPPPGMPVEGPQAPQEAPASPNGDYPPSAIPPDEMARYMDQAAQAEADAGASLWPTGN